MAAADTSSIWSEFGDGLKGYIQRRVGSPDDAADILQDVFLRIHVGLERVDDREQLAGRNTARIAERSNDRSVPIDRPQHPLLRAQQRRETAAASDALGEVRGGVRGVVN
jgi:DNA-directed RNA polymerase specialized sigma24 family protein